MSDDSESSAPRPASSPPAPKASKGGKRKGTPGVEYGKLKFHLPFAMERALRFACFELEINPKAVHKTPQALVEESVRRHLDLLSKHISFPPGMLSNTKGAPESAS